MDLDLLQTHAKRYGSWAIRLSAREELECQFHQPTNADNVSWDDYSYYLNGVRVSRAKADSFLAKAFERAIA